MDYKSVLKEIGKGKVAPVYLCYGPEKYTMRQFVESVCGALVEPEQKDMAVVRYDLAETSLEGVIEDAETLPFLVSRKIVIASGAAFFTGSKDTSKVEHRIDKLAEYLKAPVDYSVIIFTVDAEKLDERKKIVKSLKEADATVPFLSLTPNQLTHWVKVQADQAHVEMTDEAVEQIILYTGGSLQILAGELDKCFLYVGENGRLTPGLIDDLVVRSTEQNVFILIEDIVQMNLTRAFGIFHDLLKQKEEPIKIVSLIARQFRIILQVKELLSQSYSHQQIASQLGVHPYGVKVAAAQGGRYTMDKLYTILSQIADLDYGMKTGQTDKVAGLEMFLLRLAG